MKSTYAGIIREIKTYVKFVVVRLRFPAVKFVIFGAGRSGSTLLVSLLDSHPQVCCEDEILHYRVLFPKPYIRCRSALSTQNVYGFKLLSYQLKMVQRIRDPRRFVLDLSLSGYKIIHSTRRNTLRQALSNLYARYRGRFHHRSIEGSLELIKMHVDLDELLTWMAGLERTRRFEEDILRDVPYLDIVYEDDLQETRFHQPTVDKVSKYLGVPSASVRTDLVKVTPSNLSGFVANYKEVVRFIRKTEFTQFLES